MAEKKKAVHLIIPSDNLAGSEKRMLGFWLFSQKNYDRDFLLVTTEKIFRKSAESDEFADIVKYKDKIMLVPESQSRRTNLRIVRNHLFRYRKEAVMHFVLFYPLNLSLRRDRTLYTFAGYDLSYMSLAKKAILYFSFFRARKSDILDPGIYNKMRRLFFFKKNSFTLTPNSVVNLDKYKADFENKENWIVFLGRFVDHKQIIPFVKSIPAINRELQAKGIKGIKFHLLGSGEQKEEIRELLQKDEYKGIDVFTGFALDPQSILSKSKIILSVQQFNNYPSRSLLEAMACGNMPVVTNVGNTDMIADPEFSAYVSRDFSPDEIATAIAGLLSLDPALQQEKMRKARQFVGDNCRMENMANYFYKLYEGL